MSAKTHECLLILHIATFLFCQIWACCISLSKTSMPRLWFPQMCQKTWFHWNAMGMEIAFSGTNVGISFRGYSFTCIPLNWWLSGLFYFSVLKYCVRQPWGMKLPDKHAPLKAFIYATHVINVMVRELAGHIKHRWVLAVSFDDSQACWTGCILGCCCQPLTVLLVVTIFFS